MHATFTKNDNALIMFHYFFTSWWTFIKIMCIDFELNNHLNTHFQRQRSTHNVSMVFDFALNIHIKHVHMHNTTSTLTLIRFHYKFLVCLDLILYNRHFESTLLTMCVLNVNLPKLKFYDVTFTCHPITYISTFNLPTNYLFNHITNDVK